jgi:predicted  nucleic acid-binding Zn-ribbon protein
MNKVTNKNPKQKQTTEKPKEEDGLNESIERKNNEFQDKKDNEADLKKANERLNKEVQDKKARDAKEAQDKKTAESRENYMKTKFERSGGRKSTNRSPAEKTIKKLYESVEFLEEIKKKNKAILEKPSKYLSTIEVPQENYKRLQFVKGLFAEVDKYYQNLPNIYSLDELASRISNCTAEEIHLYALIYYWISKNIVYNYEGYKKGEYGKNDAESVFQSKKAVCEGFANLYLHICNKLGLKCKKVTGAAKQSTFKLGDKVSSNHAWNCIQYREQKYLIDSTWGAGHAANGHFVQQFTPIYFLTFPEVLADSHFPDNTEFLLTKKKSSLPEFKNKLVRGYQDVYKTVCQKNLALVSHQFPEISCEENLSVEVGVIDENKVYFWQLCKGDKKVDELMKTEYNDNIWYIDIKFEASGDYKLNLCELYENTEISKKFWVHQMYFINVQLKDKKVKRTPKQLEEEREQKEKTMRARSIERLKNVTPKYLEPKGQPSNKELNKSIQPVLTRRKSKSSILRYDQINPLKKFYDNENAILFEPKAPLLKIGSTVKFKVKVKGAIGCTILDYKTWTSLKHIGDDTYEGAVTIQSELIQVCSQKPHLVFTEVFEFKAIKM